MRDSKVWPRPLVRALVKYLSALAPLYTRKTRRAATVIGLGKNRGDRTVVHLAFETRVGQGRRVAGELYWRKAELKGKDKPTRPHTTELEGAGAQL